VFVFIRLSLFFVTSNLDVDASSIDAYPKGDAYFASMLTQKGMLILKTRVWAKMDDAGLADIHLLLPDCLHSADKHVFGPRSWSHSADVSR
jgi:hypothetical protein